MGVCPEKSLGEEAGSVVGFTGTSWSPWEREDALGKPRGRHIIGEVCPASGLDGAAEASEVTSGARTDAEARGRQGRYGRFAARVAGPAFF